MSSATRTPPAAGPSSVGDSLLAASARRQTQYRGTASGCTTNGRNPRCVAGRGLPAGRGPVGHTGSVIESQPETYGDTHAQVYDRIYGTRFAPDAAVSTLSAAAGDGGRLLELGLGTGRLAIPLAARGVQVDGIEASSAMIERLRTQPGGDRIGVFQTDLAGFQLPRRDYDVAVCAVSTLFMLADLRAQQRCLTSAAHHLRPGGQLFIEAFRPDASRFDASGHRVETRPSSTGDMHVVRSRHDAGQHVIDVSHELSGPDGAETYQVRLRYLEPDQIDNLARQAGLTQLVRWDDWTMVAATETSRDPINVYQKPPRHRR